MTGVQIEVVPLPADDWQRWRALRLAALTTDPAAFGSTLAEWSGVGDTEERWRGRWVGVPDNLVAVIHGRDVGAVSLFTPADGSAVELISMWVAPAVRGLGVGDALVEAVLGCAAERRPGRPVALSVYEDNGPARRLYARHGFVDAGPSPDGPCELRMLRSG